MPMAKYGGQPHGRISEEEILAADRGSIATRRDLTTGVGSLAQATAALRTLRVAAEVLAKGVDQAEQELADAQ